MQQQNNKKEINYHVLIVWRQLKHYSRIIKLIAVKMQRESFWWIIGLKLRKTGGDDAVKKL